MSTEQRRVQLHQPSRTHASSQEDAAERRKELEEALGISLDAVAHHGLDLDQVRGRNCENVIGAAQLPLGVAGPLPVTFEGEELQQDVYIPMATTEGTLVASVSRGCRAMREHGVRTALDLHGTTRAPVFTVQNLQEGREFISWIHEHQEDIRTCMNESDLHIDLVRLDTWQVGRNVFVRFNCESGEAMGMNMVTIAVQHVINNLITPETGIECTALSGNMCADKKPAAISFVMGRGRTVHAEALISRNTVEEVLKTTPEEIVNVWTRKTMVGSVRAGTLGANAHAANIVAALFIAAGQDPAHVVEGSSTITVAEVVGEDLLFSASVPAMLVGTVGGGTSLPTQRACLNLLGVKPAEGKAGSVETNRLAQIVGAAVLAGELSLHAALAAQHLAKAHTKFGRAATPVEEEMPTK